MVIGLSSQYITQPEAVSRMLELQDRFPHQLRLRYSSQETFHPKLFLFHGMKSDTALVGSSNLTGGGTHANYEVNIALTGTRQTNILSELDEMFLELDNDQASNLLNHENCKKYTAAYHAHKSIERRRIATGLEPTGSFGGPPIFADTREANLPNGIEDVEELAEMPAESVIWKISPGEGASQWARWCSRIGRANRGVIAIGFEGLGNPSQLSLDQLTDVARKKGEPKPGYVTAQLWTFYNLMRRRNLVVAYGRSSVLGVAQIDGVPKYHPDENVIFKNKLPVRWLRTEQVLLSPAERRPFVFPEDTIHRIKDKQSLGLIGHYLKHRL
jgi:hypothetical protein